MSAFFAEGKHHKRPSRFKAAMLKVAWRIDNFMGWMPA